MRRTLRQGLCHRVKAPPVKLKYHLIVVIGSCVIPVNAVCHKKHLRRAGRTAGNRTESCAIDPGAGKAMLASVGIFRRVVPGDLRQVYGAHYSVPLGVHTDTVDLIHVKNSYIKGVLIGKCHTRALHYPLTYRVVLVLYRTVHPAVLAVKGYAAKMPGKTGDSADNISIKISLHENCGEGIIYVLVLVVQSDTLNVPTGKFPAVYHLGKRRKGVFFSCRHCLTSCLS